MGEGNPCLRHPNEFDGLLSCDRQRKCLRIGKPDVFAGKNNDPPRNKTEVFPAM